MTPANRFSTARLRADRIDSGDFTDLCRMHADPEVMKTLGGLRSEEQTREYLQANLEHWDRYGFGLWILRELPGSAMIGRSALRHVDIEGRPEIELGYALFSDYWGRGFATEAVKAMLELAFEQLAISELVAFCLPDNAASRRVIEKSGGIFEREALHCGLRHVLYRFR